MSRPVALVKLVDQLPQHGGEAIDRSGRDSVAIGERRQAMIGPENIARTIDQIEMLG